MNNSSLEIYCWIIGRNTNNFLIDATENNKNLQNIYKDNFIKLYVYISFSFKKNNTSPRIRRFFLLIRRRFYPRRGNNTWLTGIKDVFRVFSANCFPLPERGISFSPKDIPAKRGALSRVF